MQVPSGEAAVQQKAQAEAEREGAALKPRIPRLVISLEGAEPSEVTLTIDGKPVAASVIGTPRLLNPGPHVVEVSRGSDHARAEVTAVEGKEQALSLKLTAAAPGAAGGPAGTGDSAAALD